MNNFYVTNILESYYVTLNHKNFKYLDITTFVCHMKSKNGIKNFCSTCFIVKKRVCI